MRVQATQLGYYDHKRRKEGAVFEIAKKEDFSENWMVSLEDEAKPAKAKAKAKKKEEVYNDEDVI